ncbi:MAG: hypothetical protein JMM77_03380 [Candidatus Xiphinematobacter sp.]|nr:MAG: hypothetical protein JMM77_03380 [Candidatus Xiphinematobacter sp.]
MNSLLGLCCDSNTSHYIRSRVRDPDPNPLDLSSARNFVLHINALAHRLGMHRTYFPNPDGPPTNRQQGCSMAADIIRWAYIIPIKSPVPLPCQAGLSAYSNHPRESGTFFPSPKYQPISWLQTHNGIDNCCDKHTRKHLILTADQPPHDWTTWEEMGHTISPQRLLVVFVGIYYNCLNDGLASLRYGWRLYDCRIT